jgi:hypothetical protein
MYPFSSASWTAFMITLLLFVAPLTASTMVDCAPMILSGMTGPASLPIHDATCLIMTMSTTPAVFNGH